MCHTSSTVAILLVENTYLEHQIMDNEEEHRPFYERDVETLQPSANELPFLRQVFQGEKISGADEEQWHVELKDERVQKGVAVGVCHHYEDNAQCLGNGYACVASHLTVLMIVLSVYVDYRLLASPSSLSLSYSFQRYLFHSIFSVVTFVMMSPSVTMVCFRICFGHPE